MSRGRTEQFSAEFVRRRNSASCSVGPEFEDIDEKLQAALMPRKRKFIVKIQTRLSGHSHRHGQTVTACSVADGFSLGPSYLWLKFSGPLSMIFSGQESFDELLAEARVASCKRKTGRGRAAHRMRTASS